MYYGTLSSIYIDRLRKSLDIETQGHNTSDLSISLLVGKGVKVMGDVDKGGEASISNKTHHIS